MTEEARRPTAADVLREAPQTPATANERHTTLWNAINEVRGKVNYLLGAMAILIPLNVGIAIAVLAK